MKKKITIVADDTSTSSYIRNILNSLDSEYEVTYVDSGMKYDWLHEDSYIPDVILIDIKIPEIDGLDVFIELKINPLLKDIPAVFLVDEDDDLNKFFIYNVLGAECIQKPVDIIDLKESIEGALGNN